MKKTITIVVASLFVALIGATSAPEAQAQPVLGGYCCDAQDYVRCRLDALYPVGNLCYCYQQGYGHVCRL